LFDIRLKGERWVEEREVIGDKSKYLLLLIVEFLPLCAEELAYFA